MPPGPYLGRVIVAWCLILLGAFFLAKSVVVKGQKWTMKELLGLRLDKLKVFRNHIIQRLEASFGFFFVLLGVATHLYVILRQVKDERPQAAYVQLLEYLGITVGAMVVFAVALHYVCGWISRRVFLDQLAYLVVRYRYRVEDDERLLKQLGEAMNVPRTEDDTVESYASRIEEGLRLDRVRARLERKHKKVELD